MWWAEMEAGAKDCGLGYSYQSSKELGPSLWIGSHELWLQQHPKLVYVKLLRMWYTATRPRPQGPKAKHFSCFRFYADLGKETHRPSSHTHTPLPQQFPQKMGYLKSTLFPPKQKQLFFTCLKTKREWEKKMKNFLKVKAPRDLRRNNSG